MGKRSTTKDRVFSTNVENKRRGLWKGTSPDFDYINDSRTYVPEARTMEGGGRDSHGSRRDKETEEPGASFHGDGHALLGVNLRFPRAMERCRTDSVANGRTEFKDRKE